MIRVLIWNEYVHENAEGKAKEIYPLGIHRTLASFLEAEEDITVRTATLQDENCGITKEILDETDVLIWWGHVRHKMVPDEVAELVQNAVIEGMGAIFLHSAHHSKPFRFLMGTPCHLTWRESGDRELLWVTNPAHPITQGIDRFLVLDHEETYGEPFIVPHPEETLLLGNFSGGEAFRAGLLYRRGNGTIFYFQPGHETYPTYHHPQVQKLLVNAVRFLKPQVRIPFNAPHVRFYDSPEGYLI